MPRRMLERAVTFWACLSVAGAGSTTPARGDSTSNRHATQGPVIVVGILEFQDESGRDGLALGAVVTRLLRQRLLSEHRDTLAKAIASPASAAEGGPPTVEQLQALGAQYAVRFVVLGGVLPITAERADSGTTITVPLYAEVVSVETRLTQTLRVEASVTTPEPVPPGVEAADAASAAFARTPLGQAVVNAVARLGDEIHECLAGTRPADVPSGGDPPSEPRVHRDSRAEQELPAGMEPPAGLESQAGAGMEPAAELDTELQQTIADAESAIAYYGNADVALAGQLRSDLERLNQALSRKADLMASSQDTQEIDQAILSTAESLRSATRALVQAGMSQQGSGPPGREDFASGEGGLARVDRLCGETLSLVQKIQELRSLLAGATQESQSAWQGEPGAALDSGSSSVTGVVVQDGQPVAGAEVTEASTGMTTTTGADGSYVLGPLPPGLNSLVQVKHRGRVVATGRVPVLSTRSALADFQLGKSAQVARQGLVLGSSAMRPATTRGSGTLSGQVMDGQGRPAARVLISVPGAGVVRTGSGGEFLLTGIPAGSYTLTAREPSLGEATSPVKVGAGGSPTTVTLRLARPVAASRLSPSPLRLVAAGATGGRVHGRVRDGEDRSLPGVAVSLVSKEGTLTARTDGAGRYALANVRPGEYRLVAARAGFETATRGVSLQAGDAKEIGLRLRQLTPLVDALRAARASAGGSGARPGESGSVVATPTGSGKVVVPGAAAVIAPPSRAGSKAPPATGTPPAAAPSPAPGRAGVGPMRTLQEGVLQGRVIDATTRKPVAGATVSVSGAGRAVTDRNGEFRIAKVAPGSLEVKVSRPGYAAGARSVNVAAGRTVTLELALRPAAAQKRYPRPGGTSPGVAPGE